MKKTLTLAPLFIFNTVTVNTAMADPLGTLPGGDASVVPHDQAYYTKDVRNIELIYTEKNLDTAKQAADVQMLLQPAYEKAFGYKLDEKLRVGLASDYNQITNGFTNFQPYALQVDYIGGALLPDHFANPSWINNLLYHETAHSFQINAKESSVSRGMHSVIKNGTFIAPWFNNPNVVTSSFLIEGNAVLNESWHGNGGRLYSGRFKIANLMQAKAGLLTPELVYNDNLEFLYGGHNYTLGSFYQYYLAENYGLETTNSYWRVNSRDWIWPFKTNYVSERVFNKDFETLVAQWSEEFTLEAKSVVEAQGKQIATSQFYSAINDDDDEVYFIVNPSGREYPEFVVYDKQSRTLKQETSTYMQSKIIKTQDKEYVVQAGRNVNPWRQYIGLYSESAFIVDGTESKVIEGYLENGKEVYFDVTKSFDQPHLFIGDEYYETVNSSVFIRGNDVYYFKQKDKDRTLYKNKKALFTIKGYYGHVAGVNDTGVYFIANTKHGSGLYRFTDGRFDLMNPADTIFDARLVDQDTALVVSMGSDQYKYMLVDLKAREQQPFETVLFMENEPYFETANPKKHTPEGVPEIDLEDSYYSMLDMHYSGLNIALGSDSDAGVVYNLNLTFADPLVQNQLNFFVTRGTDEYTLGGATYSNNQYFLNYAVTAYGVLGRPDPDPPGTVEKDKRNNGLIANASIPFLKSGYYYGDVGASYFEDYVSNSRNPKGLDLTLGNAKYFGASMDANFLLQGTAYGVEDRGDNASGGKGIYKQGLPNEFFFAVNGQYSSSDANDSVDDRGIKLAKSQAAIVADSDLSTIVMPSIKDDPSYAKDVTKYGAEIKKVFNFSSYYFTFPISLRREAFFVSYNRYEITDFNSGKSSANETAIGVDLDTLWLNILPIPIRIEYIYNDNKDVANTDTFRFQLGFAF